MLTHAEQHEALDVARRGAIDPLEAGGDGYRPGLRRWVPDVHTLRGPLAEPGACFVTLRADGALLGCIGSLAAYRPLGVDVAANAAAAAFDDPRLPPLSWADVAWAEVHISVLGAMQPLAASGFDALRGALRPGVDGLVVEASGRRATFLPSVWSQLPDVDAFLAALWRKAGLVSGSWPAGIVLHTYEVQEFSGPLAC